MGEKNNALAVYMNRPDRIRSVLEYYLGRPLPQDWDCQEIRGFYTLRNTHGKLSFRQRDFLGNARAWGRHFLLGLEHQEKIGLTFPWRLMEMDCLAYGEEIQKNQQQNSAENTRYKADDDFQYRYKKCDRITPVMTLTLYWGRKPWKKPLSLADMLADMENLPEKMRPLAGDYRIHLIQMRFISDEDLQKMDSDLKYVLGIMKCTGSRKRYEDYIRKNKDFFSRIPKSALDVIDTCTSIKDITGSLTYIFNPESGEEETDMCKALKDIKKHAERKGRRQGIRQGFQQGKEQGIQQGREQGIQQGREQGIQQGREQGTLATLVSLVADGLLQLEEAASRANLSVSAFRGEMKKAGF